MTADLAIAGRLRRRGKGRQMARVLCRDSVLTFRPEEPAMSILPPPAVRPPILGGFLERQGYHPGAAPSHQALAVDLAAYADMPCASCDARTLELTPFMRGTRYVLVLECRRCGHQEEA